MYILRKNGTTAPNDVRYMLSEVAPEDMPQPPYTHDQHILETHVIVKRSFDDWYLALDAEDIEVINAAARKKAG